MKNGMLKRQRRFFVTFLLLLFVFGMIVPVGSGLADVEVDETHINRAEWAQKTRESIPDELFGGKYFSQNGELVINLTDTNNRAVNKELIAQAPFNVVFNEVKYPLSKLEEMKDALIPYMVEYDIAMLDANDVTNMLDIVLLEGSERTKQINDLIDQISIVDPDIVNITYKKGEFKFTVGKVDGSNKE